MAEKSIAEKVRDKEPITSEEFQKLLSKVDWKNHAERVTWALNEPRCNCDSCYENWFKWGQEVYKDQSDIFEERRKEALSHLRNKQQSRKLAEKVRAEETRYGQAYSAA